MRDLDFLNKCKNTIQSFNNSHVFSDVIQEGDIWETRDGNYLILMVQVDTLREPTSFCVNGAIVECFGKDVLRQYHKIQYPRFTRDGAFTDLGKHDLDLIKLKYR